jgi:hypothetical protein
LHQNREFFPLVLLEQLHKTGNFFALVLEHSSIKQELLLFFAFGTFAQTIGSFFALELHMI